MNLMAHWGIEEQTNDRLASLREQAKSRRLLARLHDVFPTARARIQRIVLPPHPAAADQPAACDRRAA